MNKNRKWVLGLGIGVGLLAAWGLLLLLATPALAVQPGAPPRAPDLPLAWSAAAPIPQGRAANLVQCPEDPEGFYLVGGRAASGTVDTLYHYDAISNTWTLTLTAMPQPRRAVAATCYQGKIYVAGGWDSDPKDSFYIYDIAGDSWSPGPTLPDDLWGAALGAWDGKLYLVGGTRIESPYTPVNRVDVYDIGSGMWTPGGGTPMPTAAGFFGAARRGPFLFAIGGFSGNLDLNVNQTQRYDMSSDTWEMGPEFTSRRALLPLSMTGSRLYAQGGDTNGGSHRDLTDLVEYLNLADWPGGVWTDLSDPLPQVNAYGAGACTEARTGGEIWAVGGVDNMDANITSTLYRAAEACLGYTYTFTLEPDSQSGAGYREDLIEYNLTITNIGDTPDAYSSTVTSVWTTTVSGLEGALDPGLSRLVTVTVTIPSDVIDGESDTATVTVISQGDPTQQDTATLTTEALIHGITLSPSRAALAALPGESVTYTLQLTNTGEVTDTYTLSAGESQWTVTQSLTETTLGAGQAATLTIQVAIPELTEQGAMDQVLITATSQGNPDITAGSTLTTTVWWRKYMPIVKKD